jgi:hypothetical protein
VVRLLVAAEISSLLDHDETGWRQRSGQLDSNARGLLMFAHRVVADLAEGDGWDGEYGRDIWRMHRLGFEGHRSLRFTSITQPWLRELAKRFVRLRLSRGLGLEAGGGRPVLAITRFSAFLSRTGLERIDQLDRPLLEGPPWRPLTDRWCWTGCLPAGGAAGQSAAASRANATVPATIAATASGSRSPARSVTARCSPNTMTPRSTASRGSPTNMVGTDVCNSPA